jgi:hypothetical protein
MKPSRSAVKPTGDHLNAVDIDFDITIPAAGTTQKAKSRLRRKEMVVLTVRSR